MTLERRAWNIAGITILLVLVSLRIIYWQMVRGDGLQPVAVDLVQAADEYDRASMETRQTRSVDFLTRVSTVKTWKAPAARHPRTKDLLETITWVDV
jgi:hypothetical protein